MKEWEGSFTIEAAIIMSMSMLLFLAIMRIGLQMYEEMGTLAAEILKQETVDAVKLFYAIERVREIF